MTRAERRWAAELQAVKSAADAAGAELRRLMGLLEAGRPVDHRDAIRALVTIEAIEAEVVRLKAEAEA